MALIAAVSAALSPASRAALQDLEQVVDRHFIGLAQRDVDLLDQVDDRGLLVHRLVGQVAEAIAQARHHPAGQVDIGALGRAAQALDRLDHLLGVEARPAAQRLGELAAVGVVGGHVGAHDAGHFAGDVQVGREGVLQLQLDDVVDRDAARRDTPCG
jgi:hypothetical protein